MLSKTFNILFLASLLLSGTTTKANEDNNSSLSPYIFGVFPYLSPTRLDKIYAPVSQELSNSMGSNIRFRTSSTFEIFLGKLKSGYYDFALIQPFWYPVAVDQYGYLPSITMQEPFVSLILVLDDSEFENVEDLKGKVIATPPSFVPVVHMAKESLIKSGLVPGQDVVFREYKTVDSCMQHVVIRNADACIAPPFAPGPFEQAMNVKFRAIHQSYSIPNLALVIHSRVPEQIKVRISEVIRNWKNTAQGQELLSRMQTEGFSVTQNQDYDVVRKMLKKIRK